MARRQASPSLDQTGTQAAVYPSEEALWVVGPPINDGGPQGLEQFATEDEDPAPPAPLASAAQAAQEDYLHEVMNGQTPNGAYGEIWVNNAVYGPQGFGDWNEQAYETGHTQNIPSDPSTEQ